MSTLELYTDGYMKPAHEVSIESREKAYEYVEAIDPYKRKEFKSTKKSDDRTVMIISF